MTGSRGYGVHMIRAQPTITIDEDTLIEAVAAAHEEPTYAEGEGLRWIVFGQERDSIAGFWDAWRTVSRDCDAETIAHVVERLEVYCAWVANQTGKIDFSADARPQIGSFLSVSSWEEELDAARAAQARITDFQRTHAAQLKAHAVLRAAEERLGEAIDASYLPAVTAQVGDAVRAFAAGDMELDASSSLVQACVAHVQVDLQSEAFRDRWAHGYADARAGVVTAVAACAGLAPVDAAEPDARLISDLRWGLDSWRPTDPEPDVDDRAPTEV